MSEPEEPVGIPISALEIAARAAAQWFQHATLPAPQRNRLWARHVAKDSGLIVPDELSLSRWRLKQEKGLLAMLAAALAETEALPIVAHQQAPTKGSCMACQRGATRKMGPRGPFHVMLPNIALACWAPGAAAEPPAETEPAKEGA
ncbi:MAG: hypothetical protein M3O61_18610 [Gemmatimonadota bacterium]|nr:hypothetical protein [Gemmatimonadota bacterium]